MAAASWLLPQYQLFFWQNHLNYCVLAPAVLFELLLTAWDLYGRIKQGQILLKLPPHQIFEEWIGNIQGKRPSLILLPAETESCVWLYSRSCEQKLGSHQDAVKEKHWNQSRIKVLSDPDVCATASGNWSAYEEKRQ